MWQKVDEVKFNRFEFRVFLLLDQLPYQRLKAQSILLFTYSWREDISLECYVKCKKPHSRCEFKSPYKFLTMINYESIMILYLFLLDEARWIIIINNFDCCDADKRKTWGTQKGLIEKHIYSSNRSKIQVNLVKQ